MQKVTMIELVREIEISENKLIEKNDIILSAQERQREYKVIVNFEDLSAIEYAFGIDENSLK